MQPGGTQPTRGLDADTRLRLAALNTPAGPLELGGRLACVCTTPDLRTSVAETIARAVIGPRPEGVDGTLEIAGRYVALSSLPAPLLRPSAAATVDATMLADMWQRSCAQRRAELEAIHAARRLERHRTDAAIERLRARADALAVRAPAPVVDRDAAQARVVAAERVLAAASGSAIGEARTKIEAAHRAVVETERLLFEASRKERPEAHARYNAAVEAERAALTDAGVDSYASFLVAIAAGASTSERETEARAAAELAAAKTAFADAQAATEPAYDKHTAAAAVPVAPAPAPDGEMERLLHERAASDAAVETLERELAALDAQRAVSFRELDLDGMTMAVGALLESYGSGELLAGRLPIVVDGALDELDPRAVEHMASHLSSVHDAQLIVVTGTRTVAHALATAGAATHWWPVDDRPIERLDGAPVGAPAEAASSIPPMCALHPSKVSAANCANCARPGCVDCLVYVPGDAQLWCVACAESLRSRNLRLLRRRGA